MVLGLRNFMSYTEHQLWKGQIEHESMKGYRPTGFDTSTFVKNQNFRDIQFKQDDSAGWRAICNHQEDIMKCLQLSNAQQLRWKGVGAKENIQVGRNRDYLAAGRVWASKTPKAAFLLWRVQQRKLPHLEYAYCVENKGNRLTTYSTSVTFHSCMDMVEL